MAKTHTNTTVVAMALQLLLYIAFKTILLHYAI